MSLPAVLLRPATPLTAEQIIAALEDQPELSIDFGSGIKRRGLYLEDEPRPGHDRCSFHATRWLTRNGSDTERRAFDHLVDALQWLLAK